MKRKVIKVGIICSIIFGSLGVYAGSQILASNINFLSSKTSATNVQDAIEELYDLGQNGASYVTDGLVMGFDAKLNALGNGIDLTLDNEWAYFNGTSSYVPLSIYQNANTTYEAVFKASSFSSDQIKNISSTQIGGEHIKLVNNSLMYTRHIGGSYVSVSTNIELNKIYHVVGVGEGSNLKLYVNGELVSSETFTGDYKENTGTTIVMIGAEPKVESLEDHYFNGYIKSARVYNRPLTSEEVLQNYKYETK